MHKWICSGTLAITIVVAGCGGGGRSSGSGSGTDALPSTPATASLPAPSSVHFSFVASPDGQPGDGITIGPDGAVYLLGSSGFLRYAAGSITKYAYVTASGNDPLNTEALGVIGQISSGPNKTVWLISQQAPTGAAESLDYFESLNTSTLSVSVSPEIMDTHLGDGIGYFNQGPDGNMWVVLNCGPCEASLLQVYNASFSTVGTGVGIPLSHFIISPLVNGVDGAIYALYRDDTGAAPQTELVRIDVASQTVTNTFPIPSRESVEGITSGPDGAIWFTDVETNTISRVSLSGNFQSWTVPTPRAHPGGIAPASDNALWFTESDVNKIGRISLDAKMTEYAVPSAGPRPRGISAGAPSCVPRTLYFAERNGLGILTF